MSAARLSPGSDSFDIDANIIRLSCGCVDPNRHCANSMSSTIDRKAEPNGGSLAHEFARQRLDLGAPAYGHTCGADDDLCFENGQIALRHDARRLPADKYFPVIDMVLHDRGSDGRAVEVSGRP